MEIVHFLQRKYKMRELIANSKIFYRWLFYIVMIIVIISFGEFRLQEFIYFQF